LGRQIENPLGSVTAKRGNDDVPTESSCSQRTSSRAPGLSTDRFQYDESARYDPRRADARADCGFDDAIEHPEKLDLERSVIGFLGHPDLPGQIVSGSAVHPRR